jgi:hypothetical protein
MALSFSMMHSFGPKGPIPGIARGSPLPDSGGRLALVFHHVFTLLSRPDGPALGLGLKNFSSSRGHKKTRPSGRVFVFLRRKLNSAWANVGPRAAAPRETRGLHAHQIQHSRIHRFSTWSGAVSRRALIMARFFNQRQAPRATPSCSAPIHP